MFRPKLSSNTEVWEIPEPYKEVLVHESRTQFSLTEKQRETWQWLVL